MFAMKTMMLLMKTTGFALVKTLPARKSSTSRGRRAPLLAATAASFLLLLQLQSYAQTVREQPTLDNKTHAVQNSVTDATTSPIQGKGDQIANVKTFGA